MTKTTLKTRIKKIIDICMETDNVVAIINKQAKPKYKLNEERLIEMLEELFQQTVGEIIGGEEEKHLDKLCISISCERFRTRNKLRAEQRARLKDIIGR
ncbi:MAG: hypothetical protein AABY22_06710 [Nanoarchaeota archaeon]